MSRLDPKKTEKIEEKTLFDFIYQDETILFNSKNRDDYSSSFYIRRNVDLKMSGI